MTESELKELLTPEEFNKFLEFIIEKGYFWSKDSCYTEYIQEFLMTLEDNDRKEDIIYNCIQKYPKILGLEETI